MRQRRFGKMVRRGGILPLAAFCMVGLVGLLALAIDIGMIAIARSQCQNAADSAAMAGARAISGDPATNFNFDAVPGQAITAATKNTVMAQLVQGDPSPKGYTTVNAYTFNTHQVTVEVGTYAYAYNDSDPGSEKFILELPRKDATEAYSAVRATIQYPDPAATQPVENYAFARIFGLTTFNTNAVSVAAHRPRDVIIIVDLSGSMRFQSLPGIPLSGTVANPSAGNAPRLVSMNGESVFPQFGHYSDTTTAALQGTKSYSTGAEMVDLSNISASSNSGPPVCADFYQNAAGVAPGPGNVAFARAPDSQGATPGGYNYLKTSKNTGASYAATVQDIVGSGATYDANWENPVTGGYIAYGGTDKTTFSTEGPGYWGKTFFMWPPDPRGATLPCIPPNYADNGAKDWRQRFFLKYNTSTGTLAWLDHNTILFNTSGSGATAGTPKPTPVMNLPTTSTTVKENGVNVTYQYRINYAAILHWLRNQDPKPFPTIVRAGRIKYYDDIPDPKDAGLNNRWWATAPGSLANLNERFWRGYIDFVLGLQGTGAGTYTNTQSGVPISALIGNGDFYKWTGPNNTPVQIKQKPDLGVQPGTINQAGGYPAGATSIAVNTGSKPASGQYVKFDGDVTYYKISAVSGSGSPYTLTLATGLVVAEANGASLNIYSTNQLPYMDYADNPYRPRHQFWFGPMTWVDWLGNYNTNQFWWPGNVHEAQCWACKVGIQTAIDDIKHNHPNDFIGMTFFSSPQYSVSGSGQWNSAVIGLGRNYQGLKDSLWFPPTTVSGAAKEITPYDADFAHVPRAKGGTAPAMGFMIAYNQFSSSTANLRSYSQPEPLDKGLAGGVGRKGAQRLIIFETDGAPNTGATASLVSSGADSYYRIRLVDPLNYNSPKNVEWPSNPSYADSDVFAVVSSITAKDTASPPGYSRPRRPVLVYPIGYGSMFDPANPSSGQTTALTFLQNIAFRGNTATDTNPNSFPDWQRIYGDNQMRINRIQKAFTNIMQAGVQVSLIQ
jgi:Putative Flp pilus-assembly TadE/G-like